MPRRTRLLPHLDLGAVLLVLQVHELHGAPGADGGGQVVAVDPLVDDQDAGSSRPAQQLVRGEEDAVQEAVLSAADLDAGVRGDGRVVEEGQGVVAVQEAGHLEHGGDQPGHVGGGGEGPDFAPVAVFRVGDLALQVGQVQQPLLVQLDLHDLGEALAPGNLVAFCG